MMDQYIYIHMKRIKAVAIVTGVVIVESNKK